MATLFKNKVDVVFTPWGTGAALAAKRATASIPIVIGAAGDPVRARIVASFTRPGGNVTGLSSLALEVEGKRVEFAKEVFQKPRGSAFSGIPKTVIPRLRSRKSMRRPARSACEFTR